MCFAALTFAALSSDLSHVCVLDWDYTLAICLISLEESSVCAVKCQMSQRGP